MSKPKTDKEFVEYILVSDRDSKVLFSGTYQQCVRRANFARAAGGEVTIFKATKG